MTDIIDFGASFLTFRVDWEEKPSQTASHKPPFTLNNARIQIESVCQIIDTSDGSSTRYALGASCKTERVGVDRDIWTEPNADFCIVLSDDSFLILKSWDRNDKGVMRYPESLGVQPERQVGKTADTYDTVKINIRHVPGERLATVQDIVMATLNDDVLVGRVEFTLKDHFDVIIDFPIKTMNANEREWIYQTDTGPVLLPNLDSPHEDLIETFDLAYVAYNCPDWAEFIVQTPTPLNDEISVNHYSESRHLKTRNSTFKRLFSG